ncbi:MAG TPA: STAS domain-containing protein [Candidatus Cybelea sp.]|nr:STAS domain-containing protein [Candidatus Cybelea sp.]
MIQTIRLAGELDLSRKRELRDAFALSSDARAVLLDLSEVLYADSTALTELLRFCAMAQTANAPIAIVIAAPQFLRLVQYAGLATAFKIFHERGEALRYLSERTGN